MKVQKRVAHFVSLQLVSWIAGAIYFAGLTALIPIVPLVISPIQFVNAQRAFAVALAFIVFGFALVYIVSRSKKIALRTLGMVTLVPGLIAVFFSYSGERRMTELMRWFSEAPLFEKYIETHVPKAWLLAGIYIILGVLLIWLSEKSKR